MPQSHRSPHTHSANYPIRQHTRLAHYDYSHAGSYFVTIRSCNGRPTFGYVNDGLVQLSQLGLVMRRCWLEIATHFPTTEPDVYIVMPHHIHGLLFTHETHTDQRSSKCPNLSHIIGSFKSAVTREWHGATGETEAIWQRGYYEHVIRRNESLDRIRQYVVNNPIQWSLDPDNPDCKGRR